MKHRKWFLPVVIAATAILIICLVFCIIIITKNIITKNNERPENAFKKCFGFPLPDGVEIVTYQIKTHYPKDPIYAFEIVFHESKLDEMVMRTSAHAYDLRDKYNFQDNCPWLDLDDICEDFFERSCSLDCFPKEIWKENNPKEKVCYVSTYNDVEDTPARTGIHRMYFLLTKEKDYYRLYMFTS